MKSAKMIAWHPTVEQVSKHGNKLCSFGKLSSIVEKEGILLHEKGKKVLCLLKLMVLAPNC